MVESQLLLEELAELGLGIAHPRAGEGSDQHDVLGRDSRTLLDEVLAILHRNVLQGVACHDQVEGPVPEREFGPVPEHQTIDDVAGLPVDTHDLVTRKELEQESGSAADIEDTQGPPIHSAAVRHVRDQAVAFVLIDRESEE
jgi:hypothetical protein